MISIYKPNKKNEGCACSFGLGKDLNVYINAIQQYSWDENKKTGSFRENAEDKDRTATIKLNEFEMGGIIFAIDHLAPWSAFHSFDDNKTQISLTVWEKNDEKKTKAFGLSITRNSTDKFKLPIELGEAQVIRHFLSFCLNKRFVADEKKNSNPQQ